MINCLRKLWPRKRSVSFVTASLSKIGGREVNEDSVGESYVKDRVCLVVADGLGGHGAGEVASRIAVDTILQDFNSLSNLSTENVNRLLLSANKAIAEARSNTPGGANMASTGAVLVADASGVICGHVGDSRIYRFRKNQWELLTTDHSMAQLLVKMGNLELDQVRSCPDRNALLQSLGDANCKPEVSKAEAIHDQDVFLLCSDGWWDYLTEQDMLDQLKQLSTLTEWLSMLEEQLLARVTAIGKQQDHDNYTALALRIKMQ